MNIVFVYIAKREDIRAGASKVLILEKFKYTQVRFCLKTLSCPLRSCLFIDLTG
jgi:hypothetical protein